MLNKFSKDRNPIVWFCLLIVLFCSCNTYKTVPYFTDLPDTGRASVPLMPYQEPIIQPDDILSITVQTIDPANNALFPTDNAAAVPTGSPDNSLFLKTGGYLVDKNGHIELPFTGTVNVGGLTRLQARDTIYNRLRTYFKTLTVDVRFANFKITVLGEVLHPATYTVPNEKVNLFDALGLAGDLTVYGRRENVVLVRDSANQKNLVRLNLNSKDIIRSPYFYLKQNDVLYVEPNEAKAASLDAVRNRNIALIGSGLSVLLILLTRVL